MVKLNYAGHGVSALAAGARLVQSVSGRAKASGKITFSDNLEVGDKISINGVDFFAVEEDGGDYEFELGANLGATLDALVTLLNANSDSRVNVATYSKGGSTALVISYDVAGEAGNAMTYGSAKGTADGTHLTGGADTDALRSDVSVILLTTRDGVAQTWNLKPGKYEGQTIEVYFKTKGTSANAVVTGVFQGGNTLTFDTAGKHANLMWVGDKWVPLVNTGAVS